MDTNLRRISNVLFREQNFNGFIFKGETTHPLFLVIFVFMLITLPIIFICLFIDACVIDLCNYIFIKISEEK